MHYRLSKRSLTFQDRCQHPEQSHLPANLIDAVDNKYVYHRYSIVYTASKDFAGFKSVRRSYPRDQLIIVRRHQSYGNGCLGKLNFDHNIS